MGGNQRSWLVTTTQPANDSNASSSARKVSTSRSFVGSSSIRTFHSTSGAPPAGVDTVALAARHQILDPLLLVVTLEVEPGDVSTGRDTGADLQELGPLRDLVEGGLGAVEHVAALVDVGSLTVSPMRSVPPSGFSLPGDHAKERGFSGAVGADGADDAATREG